MEYRITKAQWELIEASCKLVVDGQRFFREFDEPSQRIVNVPVVIVAQLDPVVPPAHYASCWPNDPRD